MSKVIYLTALIVSSFGALLVLMYACLRLLKVSNGYSLLDPDISDGHRIRKWFLLAMVIFSGTQLICSLVELFLFSIDLKIDGILVDNASLFDKSAEC